jgi:2,5-diketo-D-gluconate reductase A
MDAQVALREGGTIPMLGLGTYLLNDEQAKDATLQALQLGYTHIDTAEFYANHAGINAGMKAAGVDRSKIFITDKLAPDAGGWGTWKGYDQVIDACKLHLQKLDIEYFDLYLIHHGYSGQEKRVDQWRALCELRKSGLCTHIGVSNFSQTHIEELSAAGLEMPEVNQIEIHPLCTQKPLVAYCRQNGILPIAYSSLAPASSWRIDPNQNSSKTAETCGAASMLGALIPQFMAKYSVTEAQLLLKWAYQHGYPIIPKSVRKERIAANADLFNFTISAEDLSAMDACDENKPLAWPGMNPLEAP